VIRQKIRPEVLDAIDQRRLQPLHLSGQLETRETGEQLLEEDPDLEPRQVSTEAEVLSDTEAQVWPGSAAPMLNSSAVGPKTSSSRSADE